MSNQDNKKLAMALWRAIDSESLELLESACKKFFSQSCIWNGPAPIYMQRGASEIIENFWAPLKRAIPNLKHEFHMVFGGSSSGDLNGKIDGRNWVCGTGYLTGCAVESFLGIPPSPKILLLRWGEFLRFENGMIVEGQFILDFIDWFDQINLSVLPSPRGKPFLYPHPTTCSGVLLSPQDNSETNKTLTLGRDFLFGALNNYNGKNLQSMGVQDFFHKKVKWYGPGGIGACLSLREFEDYHQGPWLVAFPDRKVQNLDSLFAEGNLLAASGVVAVRATQMGPYLGMPASGKSIEFSGLDFWLRSGNKFLENWVLVDMIDLFLQMGHDLFAKMRKRAHKLEVSAL